MRLRVAQFLANLWQGPSAVVYATDAGATVPQASITSYYFDPFTLG
jgi:hypothetical protein